MPVANSQVVGWRGHDKIDTFVCEPRHSLDAILLAKIELGHRSKMWRSRYDSYSQKWVRLFALRIDARTFARIRLFSVDVGQTFKTEDR